MRQSINEIIELYKNASYQESFQKSLILLKKAPKNITLLLNCGNVYYINHDYENAILYYEKAYKISPDNEYVLANIANCYFEKTDYENANNYAGLFLQKKYDSDIARTFGASLLEMEKYPQAVKFFEQKINYEKEKLKQEISIWDNIYFAEALYKTGSKNKALEVFKAALSVPIEDEKIHLNMGYVFYDIIRDDNVDTISDIIQIWQKNNPQSANVMHWSNAFLTPHNLSKTDSSYVQNIFDSFAVGFEKVLADLDYQVPQYISGFCKEFLKKKIIKNYQILDAGCGTGLCGKFLKKYSRFGKLIGVDLSEKMLEIAQGKNLYNQLICNDINSFMDGCDSVYDVICAADVLTYFGELDSFFLSAKKCLKKDGKIFFSISENKQDDNDYFLHISGRFLHHYSYVEKCISNNGFKMLKSEKKVLRKEGGEPVWGYLLAIEKTS